MSDKITVVFHNQTRHVLAGVTMADETTALGVGDLATPALVVRYPNKADASDPPDKWLTFRLVPGDNVKLSVTVITPPAGTPQIDDPLAALVGSPRLYQVVVPARAAALTRSAASTPAARRRRTTGRRPSSTSR